MKKLIFSFILGVGFGVYGYAAHKPSQGQIQQKEDQTKVKKTEKYDFSLFKFIAPKVVEEKDSLKKETPKSTDYRDKSETTYLYEKERTFLRFSYDS